ncbi:hypothetical protein FFLO_06308 [Filobasidium floriforme]|uniref:Uncharacterized protein n=1 Tax=Filobasidium floriforme TaxID=5210 RepID=A0A8K0JGJ2_9TREE|nr:hypothetical protein FFLO_06308 [Filobasidium floriforme]
MRSFRPVPYPCDLQQNLIGQSKELILYIYPRSSPVHDQLSIHFDKGNTSSGSINTDFDPVRATTDCTIVKCSAIPLKIEGHALVGACSTAHKNHRDLWSMLIQKDFLSGLKPESDNASDESDEEGDAEGTDDYHRMQMGDSKSDDDSNKCLERESSDKPPIHCYNDNKRIMDSSEESNLITTDVEFSYGDKLFQGRFRSHGEWKEVTLHICLADHKKGEPTSVFTFASSDKAVSDKSPEFSSMKRYGDYEMHGPAALIVIGGYAIVRVNSNAFDSHKDHWNFLVSEEFQIQLMKEKENRPQAALRDKVMCARPPKHKTQATKEVNLVSRVLSAITVTLTIPKKNLIPETLSLEDQLNLSLKIPISLNLPHPLLHPVLLDYWSAKSRPKRSSLHVSAL